MVHYKLTYFLSRGLADVSRQLFHLAGVEFEDERLNRDQFLERKESFPFKQVPVLTVDGLEIPQSMAIARYLATKFGFAGKTPEESALVDAFVDQFKDFYAEIHDYFYTMLGFTQLDGEEQKEKVLIPARDKFLPLLAKFLAKSKSGFLVDSGITFADLIIVDDMTTLINWWPQYADGYPEILAWRERVMNYPKLKEYIEKRPVTMA
ncbi:CRE-GST-13 protein [Caenorhabditis remanei]|uniref:glutathione transferase n=1 Tax=Caenorhabditis remanei TaxID=31234 RepID=E3N388_CAERE|nr:CRE-GST-13 protein [Caenorhabditis remanei]